MQFMLKLTTYDDVRDGSDCGTLGGFANDGRSNDRKGHADERGELHDGDLRESDNVNRREEVENTNDQAA
jgi:hypothetical protein